MDRFLPASLARVVGVLLLAVAVAGVAEESGIGLLVGGWLMLGPTVAALAGRKGRHG